MIFNLKSINENVEDMYNDIEDYLDERVKETTKYEEFYEVQITLYYSPHSLNWINEN